MILYKNNNFLVKNIETIHKDILVIQCQIYSLELRMILVYMSVTNYDCNNQLIQYVQKHIGNTKNYIILGDFNGHIEFLGPQSMNKNGDMMLDIIDKNNPILLIGHPECKGETSRKFTAHVQIKINHNTTLEQNEAIIKEAKQQCLVRTINKRFSNITGEEEKTWFCEQINR